MLVVPPMPDNWSPRAGPVPPGRWRKPKGYNSTESGYRGEQDRYDAIVGRRGFITMDGGMLHVYVGEYKTSQGVTYAAKKICELGGRVVQLGDFELSATVPLDRIDDVLGLIKVSRLHPGSATAFKPRNRDADAA